MARKGLKRLRIDIQMKNQILNNLKYVLWQLKIGKHCCHATVIINS